MSSVPPLFIFFLFSSSKKMAITFFVCLFSIGDADEDSVLLNLKIQMSYGQSVSFYILLRSLFLMLPFLHNCEKRECFQYFFLNTVIIFQKIEASCLLIFLVPFPASISFPSAKGRIPFVLRLLSSLQSRSSGPQTLLIL